MKGQPIVHKVTLRLMSEISARGTIIEEWQEEMTKVLKILGRRQGMVRNSVELIKEGKRKVGE